jgi:hypothetical protein
MNQPDTAAPAPNAPTQEERTWGMLAHLSAFAGLILPLVGNIVLPLLIWLVRRDRSAFVADQARESLNFNLSVVIASFVCAALVYVFIGILLGVALFVYWLAMTILAGIKAGEGVAYRYPLALRFVK